MSNYTRVIPRDLFNEANLLKLYGRLALLLGETQGHNATLSPDMVENFDIKSDPTSGNITVANLRFQAGGTTYHLERPLNSRNEWPLWVERSDDDENFEAIEVFDDGGDFSDDFRKLINCPAF